MRASHEKHTAADGTSRAYEMTMAVRLTVHDIAGATMKDRPGASGNTRWALAVPDPLPIPPEATRLHEEARVAGGRGDYDRALELLSRAHSLAPTWPYPLYDAA